MTCALACEKGGETPSCKGSESLIIVLTGDRSSIFGTVSSTSSDAGAVEGVNRNLLGESCVASSSSPANLQVPFSR